MQGQNVSTGTVAVERRHVWQNWSEEFVVESDRRRGPVEKGSVCPAKEFRRGHRATKYLEGEAGYAHLFIRARFLSFTEEGLQRA